MKVKGLVRIRFLVLQGLFTCIAALKLDHGLTGWRSGVASPAPAPALAIAPRTPATSFPVTRVVNLLQEMKASLEKEQEEDEEIYEKLACWCETNDKSKTKAISDAEAKLTTLQSTIEKKTALKETLGVEMDALSKEIAENQRSLQEASAIRGEQAADFTAEEKEMMESITALGAAIMVLSKHQEGTALIDKRHGGVAAAKGGSASAMKAAAVAAKKELERHAQLLLGVVTPHQRRVIAALAQESQPSGGYFDSAPTYKNAYEPQSGEIFGILRQMKESFESNLAQSQKDELAAQETFRQLKAAKESEIATGQTALEDKQQQLADTEEKLAQAKDEREDTMATLDADKQFLMDLKLRCSMTDKDWEDRQKLRQSEIQAVADALSILTTDDARETFSRTFNAAASFLQARSQDSGEPQRRARAAKTLMATATRVKDPKLSMLATSVRLDAFTQVKSAIDNMVAELLKEADDETKHREFCIDEMAKNERSTASKEHSKIKVEASIENLQITINDLNATIATLNSEVSDLEAQRQKAKQDRDLEHQEFEATVADQRQTQALLQEALTKLQAVYTHTKVPALIQANRSNVSYGPPPPKDFATYEQSQHAGGVVSLLMHIIENARALEADALRAEQQSLTDYQDFVQRTSDSVVAKKDSIVARQQELSQAEQDLIVAQQDHGGVVNDLAGLSNDLAALHGSCDFLLKNFDARTQARNEEIAALREAKAYLSGMTQ